MQSNITVPSLVELVLRHQQRLAVLLETIKRVEEALEKSHIAPTPACGLIRDKIVTTHKMMGHLAATSSDSKTTNVTVNQALALASLWASSANTLPTPNECMYAFDSYGSLLIAYAKAQLEFLQELEFQVPDLLTDINNARQQLTKHIYEHCHRALRSYQSFLRYGELDFITLLGLLNLLRADFSPAPAESKTSASYEYQHTDIENLKRRTRFCINTVQIVATKPFDSKKFNELLKEITDWIAYETTLSVNFNFKKTDDVICTIDQVISSLEALLSPNGNPTWKELLIPSENNYREQLVLTGNMFTLLKLRICSLPHELIMKELGFFWRNGWWLSNATTVISTMIHRFEIGIQDTRNGMTQAMELVDTLEQRLMSFEDAGLRNTFEYMHDKYLNIPTLKGRLQLLQFWDNDFGMKRVMIMYNNNKPLEEKDLICIVNAVQKFIIHIKTERLKENKSDLQQCRKRLCVEQSMLKQLLRIFNKHHKLHTVIASMLQECSENLVMTATKEQHAMRGKPPARDNYFTLSAALAISMGPFEESLQGTPSKIVLQLSMLSDLLSAVEQNCVYSPYQAQLASGIREVADALSARLECFLRDCVDRLNILFERLHNRESLTIIGNLIDEELDVISKFETLLQTNINDPHYKNLFPQLQRIKNNLASIYLLYQFHCEKRECIGLRLNYHEKIQKYCNEIDQALKLLKDKQISTPGLVQELVCWRESLEFELTLAQEFTITSKTVPTKTEVKAQEDKQKCSEQDNRSLQNMIQELLHRIEIYEVRARVAMIPSNASKIEDKTVNSLLARYFDDEQQQEFTTLTDVFLRAAHLTEEDLNRACITYQRAHVFFSAFLEAQHRVALDHALVDRIQTCRKQVFNIHTNVLYLTAMSIATKTKILKRARPPAMLTKPTLGLVRAAMDYFESELQTFHEAQDQPLHSLIQNLSHLFNLISSTENLIATAIKETVATKAEFQFFDDKMVTLQIWANTHIQSWLTQIETRLTKIDEQLQQPQHNDLTKIDLNSQLRHLGAIRALVTLPALLRKINQLENHAHRLDFKIGLEKSRYEIDFYHHALSENIRKLLSPLQDAKLSAEDRLERECDLHHEIDCCLRLHVKECTEQKSNPKSLASLQENTLVFIAKRLREEKNPLHDLAITLQYRSFIFINANQKQDIFCHLMNALLVHRLIIEAIKRINPADKSAKLQSEYDLIVETNKLLTKARDRNWFTSEQWQKLNNLMNAIPDYPTQSNEPQSLDDDEVQAPTGLRSSIAPK